MAAYATADATAANCPAQGSGPAEVAMMAAAVLACVVALALAVGRVLAYCSQMTPRPGQTVQPQKQWWSLEE
jgi:hypothetical protein